MIEVWNSSGRQLKNGAYFTHAIRYLYDELAATSPDALPPIGVWRQPWTLEDRYGDSPRQDTNYDCDIFTMVSIALLAQGVRLNQNSYTQSIVYGLATPWRIAYLIWASARDNGRVHPRGIIGSLRTRAT